MLATIRRTLEDLVVNPGRVARRYHCAIAPYKLASDFVTAAQRRRLLQLASALSPPPFELRVPDHAGYRIVSPGVVASAEPLMTRCRGLIGQEAQRPSKKTQLQSLVGIDQIGQFTEFLEFCLDPVLLGVAVNYLGELPILTSVEFWHSRATGEAYDNSQLYHSDLDDVRQFKIFLFVSDVDSESGPLTLLPANRSQEVRERLRYRPRSGHVRIEDERIRPLLRPDDERVLTGPQGTVVFADTSRLLHFGSRVTSRDRYVVMVQYLTRTNFMYHPLSRSTVLPYAHLARPGFTPVQRAVLGARG